MEKEKWMVLKTGGCAAVIFIASILFLARHAVADVDCNLAAYTALGLENTTIVSVEAVTGGTFTTPDTGTPYTGLPDFCRVVLNITPTADSNIGVEVWMPISDSVYNNRFLGVGGGGYAGGISYSTMGSRLPEGYALASTDTGHTPFAPGYGSIDGSFALKPDGTFNTEVITDFASRSLHEMTVKAKAIITAGYGEAPSYSYWYGCSTGGRQGLMLAQRYPGDYDGTISGCSAIYWDKMVPSELWPQVVMNNDLGGTILADKFATVNRAAVAACDSIDGVPDGVIDDPTRCSYDAQALQTNVCTETDADCLTSAEAVAINKFWEGPTRTDGSFLWYGLERGAPFIDPVLSGLANPSGPFPIAAMHFQYWLEQDPNFDWTTLDYAGFEAGVDASVDLWNSVVGTDDPDLSLYRDSGGKLIMWAGWADPLIFPKDTVNYYDEVLSTMGGATHVETFARLFMAPGVGHCAGGDGPNSFDMLPLLVEWVENGTAPETVIATKYVNDNPAEGVDRTRPLCPYPLAARYTGNGDINDAANFTCGDPLDFTVTTATSGVTISEFHALEAQNPPSGFIPFTGVGFTADNVTGGSAQFSVNFDSLPSSPIIYKVTADGTWAQLYPDTPECDGIMDTDLTGTTFSFTMDVTSSCNSATNPNQIKDALVAGSVGNGGSDSDSGCFISAIW